MNKGGGGEGRGGEGGGNDGRYMKKGEARNMRRRGGEKEGKGLKGIGLFFPVDTDYEIGCGCQKMCNRKDSILSPNDLQGS